MPSKIEWTDKTWNPVTGCSRVSEGCEHCYAARMSKRLQAMGLAKYAAGFDVTTHAEVLAEPLSWKTPQRIFVCSMSDLFHPDVPFDFIGAVYGIIQSCTNLTVQVLTKRPERALEFYKWIAERSVDYPLLPRWTRAASLAYGLALSEMPVYESRLAEAPGVWPPPNLHLGVTIELRKYLGRVFQLAKCPAAAYFISAEPLLGDLSDIQPYLDLLIEAAGGHPKRVGVIVGGESGPGARPMKPAWPRDLRDYCKAGGVPFFMKQMTKKAPIPDDLMIREMPEVGDA